MPVPNDMKLERMYSELTDDQKKLLTSLNREHPNDLAVELADDVAVVKARLEHWINWVDYLMVKSDNEQE